MEVLVEASSAERAAALAVAAEALVVVAATAVARPEEEEAATARRRRTVSRAAMVRRPEVAATWTEDVAIAVGSTTRPHGGAPTHAHARASGRGTGTDLLLGECDMMMRSAVIPPALSPTSVHYIWGCWV